MGCSEDIYSLRVPREAQRLEVIFFFSLETNYYVEIQRFRVHGNV